MMLKRVKLSYKNWMRGPHAEHYTAVFWVKTQNAIFQHAAVQLVGYKCSVIF